MLAENRRLRRVGLQRMLHIAITILV